MTSIFNSKITEIENKIPDVKNLAGKSELTVPDVSNLVTKTNYETKIREIEGKINNCVTTTLLNTLLKNYVGETKFNTELKKVCDRVSSNKTKYLLLENEIKKLEKVDAAYFTGKNYFTVEDGTQNDLVFQVSQKYFDSTWVQEGFWRSKGFLNQ